MAPREMSGATLAACYFFWLAAVGAFGPLLADYLTVRGFSPRAAAWLLALLPVVRVLTTPAWTYLADLLHAPAIVLRVVAFGSLASFLVLTHVHGAFTLATMLLVYSVFRAPVGALLDSVTLAWMARSGRSFGEVRAWGSVGYLLTTFLAATSIARHGHGPSLVLTAVLLLLGLLAVWTLPATTARPRGSLWPSFRRMLATPAVRRVLAAGVLHQLGLAPYDGLFAAWMLHRAGGVWTGLAVALGVLCEVAVMLRCRPWLARVGPQRALQFAFLASVLRWLVTALAPWTVLVVLAQSLHALTFGVYFVAATEAIDQAVPEEVRTSAQGIHYTVSFGMGSALALALAGTLGGVHAMRTVFLLAALASALAGWVVAEADGHSPRHPRR